MGQFYLDVPESQIPERIKVYLDRPNVARARRIRKVAFFACLFLAAWLVAFCPAGVR